MRRDEESPLTQSWLCNTTRKPLLQVLFSLFLFSAVRLVKCFFSHSVYISAFGANECTGHVEAAASVGFLCLKSHQHGIAMFFVVVLLRLCCGVSFVALWLLTNGGF